MVSECYTGNKPYRRRWRVLNQLRDWTLKDSEVLLLHDVTGWFKTLVLSLNKKWGHSGFFLLSLSLSRFHEASKWLIRRGLKRGPVRGCWCMSMLKNWWWWWEFCKRLKRICRSVMFLYAMLSPVIVQCVLESCTSAVPALLFHLYIVHVLLF